MQIAFTLCSNNYLASARVLGISFLKFHKEIRFIIGLVDKKSPQIDYSTFENIEIIPVEQLNIPDFDKLVDKFNIIELNTTVKPYYFTKFFFEEGADGVIYLDPDIQVFNRMTEVLDSMNTNMITLTPHLLSPIDDEYGPNDYHILRGGIFNLGFIALSKFQQLKFFLNWWTDRCIKYGFRNDNAGLFYDQIWMNYVPTFFDSYYILKHPGYNMANWNLHERFLTLSDKGNWVVNDSYALVFYHFSHYNIEKPDVISSYNSRFSFANRKDIKPLFDEYHKSVLQNHGLQWKLIQPAYQTKPIVTEKKTERKQTSFLKVKRKLISILNTMIPG